MLLVMLLFRKVKGQVEVSAAIRQPMQAVENAELWNRKQKSETSCKKVINNLLAFF
jgi:hypothetical protein